MFLFTVCHVNWWLLRLWVHQWSLRNALFCLQGDLSEVCQWGPKLNQYVHQGENFLTTKHLRFGSGFWECWTAMNFLFKSDMQCFSLISILIISPCCEVDNRQRGGKKKICGNFYPWVWPHNLNLGWKSWSSILLAVLTLKVRSVTEPDAFIILLLIYFMCLSSLVCKHALKTCLLL